MRRKALGKHRWSVIPGLLLCITAAGPVYAAPERTSTQIAIGNPLPNSLVAGRISLSVAYDRGMGQITALTLFVDDKIVYSRNVLGSEPRGLHYLELDTRTIPDGNHIVKVVAMGTRGPLALDEVAITVRNGIAGGVDLVPPLVQIRGLQDGDIVSGKLNLDILAEDNSGTDLLVSLFVNRQPRFLKNRPPYSLELNTSEYLDPVTKRGTLLLEAWAFDKANNLGKSRQLTLQVVEPGKENETRKQEDPTRTPVIAAPMLPDVTMKTPAPAPSELVVDIPTGPKNVEPVAPKAVSGTPGGRPVLAPGAKSPGEKPATAAVKQPSVAEKTPALQKGPGGSGSLAGSREVTPDSGRPMAAAVAAKGGVAAPAPLKAEAAGAPSGTRSSTPGTPPPATVKVTIENGSAKSPATVAAQDPAKPELGGPRATMPPARPVRVAQAKPFNPEVVPPKAPAKPQQIVSAKIDVSMPEIIDRPGELNELRVGASVPMPSPGGARASLPAVRPETTPAPRGNGLIVVTVDKKNRDKAGNPKVDILRLNEFPVDRDHQVSSGESLHSIARKYGVTVKSLQVANGIQSGRALRAGSILKVPGAFDVVLDNKRVAFDVAPRVENGLPITPFRQIMEYAGGVVVWDAEKQEVNAANETAAIRLKIGSKEALVNQTVIVMDREAFIDSGRTMVPISFMEKALDLKAEYDVKSGTIMLVRR